MTQPQRFSTSVLLTTFCLASAFGAEIVPNREGLVVHEWGTFTSVADERGESVAWAPLIETPDLPCFVNRLNPNPKSAYAEVRMETPVLYFYSQRDLDLSVHVAFPHGLITEWYPKATKVTPQMSTGQISPGYRDGQIAWDALHVTPGPDPMFPTGEGVSRYCAARHTDAVPLEIAGQHEKMIFYRGIGDFAIPLRAVIDSQGRLEIANRDADSLPLVIYFENRDGRMGYRLLRDLKGHERVEPPVLDGNLDQVRLTLANELVARRLYPKEAAAMIETWHDSWFENGSRIIYIVPRAMVDKVLPLNVAPSPASVERVFVGRIELLSPAVRQTIESALTKGDVPTLAKFGRFLDPFVNQIRGSSPGVFASHAATDYFMQANQQVWRSLGTSCIR